MYRSTIITLLCSIAFIGCSNDFKHRLLAKVAAFKGPLSVVEVTPAAEATEVSRTASITVTFNQAVDANTVNSGNFTLTRFSDGEAVDGHISFGGATTTFKPDSPLNFNETYTIKLAAGAKSLGGGALENDFEAKFKVKDELKIMSTTPVNGATGVAKNSSVIVAFNNSLDTNTILNSIVVKQNSTGYVVQGNTKIIDANTLVFEPNDNELKILETYAVTISHNIKDTENDGFGIVDDQFSFTIKNYINGYTDISQAVGVNIKWGGSVSTIFDAINKKILIIGVNYSSNKPVLFRCDVDGVGCEYKDISSGISYTTNSLTAFIYAAKLFVVYPPDNGSYMPRMLRCDLDGTPSSCEDMSVSAGGVAQISSGRPSAVVYNNELLLVGYNGWLGGRISLFRCNSLTATVSCTHVDISTASNASGYGAAVVAYNNWLFVVSEGVNAYAPITPSLVRCNLNGVMTCEYKKIFSGQGETAETPGISYNQSPVIASDGSLLIMGTNGFKDNKLSLYRCTAITGVIGSVSCTHTDISASVGLGAGSGYYPQTVIDTVGGKLLTVTSNNEYLSLFSCTLSKILLATPVAECSHTATGITVGDNLSTAFQQDSQSLWVGTENWINHHLFLHR